MGMDALGNTLLIHLLGFCQHRLLDTAVVPHLAYDHGGFQFAAKDASKRCVLDRGTTCTRFTREIVRSTIESPQVHGYM